MDEKTVIIVGAVVTVLAGAGTMVSQWSHAIVDLVTARNALRAANAPRDDQAWSGTSRPPEPPIPPPDPAMVGWYRAAGGPPENGWAGRTPPPAPATEPTAAPTRWWLRSGDGSSELSVSP